LKWPRAPAALQVRKMLQRGSDKPVLEGKICIMLIRFLPKSDGFLRESSSLKFDRSSHFIQMFPYALQPSYCSPIFGCECFHNSEFSKFSTPLFRQCSPSSCKVGVPLLPPRTQNVSKLICIHVAIDGASIPNDETFVYYKMNAVLSNVCAMCYFYNPSYTEHSSTVSSIISTASLIFSHS
jgi:hypothetical protein